MSRTANTRRLRRGASSSIGNLKSVPSVFLIVTFVASRLMKRPSKFTVPSTSLQFSHCHSPLGKRIWLKVNVPVSLRVVRVYSTSASPIPSDWTTPLCQLEYFWTITLSPTLNGTTPLTTFSWPVIGEALTRCFRFSTKSLIAIVSSFPSAVRTMTSFSSRAIYLAATFIFLSFVFHIAHWPSPLGKRILSNRNFCDFVVPARSNSTSAEPSSTEMTVPGIQPLLDKYLTSTLSPARTGARTSVAELLVGR